MDDKDVIRKGAVLIDWEVDSDNWTYPEVDGIPKQVHLSWGWVQDIIAAQIVRQIDVLDNFWVDSDPHGTAKVWSGSAFSVGDMARIAKANDEDRTMNSIRAIVDSGVLESE